MHTVIRRHRVGRYSRAFVALLAVTACVVCSVPSVATAQPSSTECRNVSIPFELAGQTGPIAGTLCAPPGATTAQILVPGWTYDRNYWQFQYKPSIYSYARAVNRAGYATLAIDRLGGGASMRPLSTFNTYNANARAVHSMIQALRRGYFGQPYHKVISVGHSMGSIVAQQEAGQYNDVDALITTGFTHAVNYLNVAARVVAADEPAMLLPRFGSVTDPLYVSTIPGMRSYFYNTAQAEPEVIHQDEQHETIDSLVDIATAAAFNTNNAAHNINIPVLDVNGDQDHLFCGLNAAECTSPAKLIAHERGWYGPNATVRAYLARGAAHDVQLHRSAPETDAAMLRFCEESVGHGRGRTETTPGVPPPTPSQPTTTPAPRVAQLAHEAFTQAIAPAERQLIKAASTAPGVGNTDALASPVVNRSLQIIANMNNRILGSVPATLLGQI
jgi:pimeloyl-ACP methyl ester carboxylesterase